MNPLLFIFLLCVCYAHARLGSLLMMTFAHVAHNRCLINISRLTPEFLFFVFLIMNCLHYCYVLSFCLHASFAKHPSFAFCSHNLSFKLHSGMTFRSPITDWTTFNFLHRLVLRIIRPNEIIYIFIGTKKVCIIVMWFPGFLI